MFGIKQRQQLQRARRDISGNVAVITALAILPIISIAGIAIDMQTTVTMKNKAQYVIDSAVLAGAKSKQAGLTDKQVRQDVRRYIRQLLKNEGSGLACDRAKVSFVTGQEDIVVKLRCFQDTSITQMLGRDKLEFNVTSTSTYGISKVDVAFIFDNSGSMGWDNRMSKLKDSAEAAVDALLPDDWQTNTDVRIAIAPYNSSLNVGDYFDDVTKSVKRYNIESPNVVGAKYDSDIVGRVQLDASNGNRRFFDYEQVRCTGSNYWGCYRYEDKSARKTFESSCVYERISDERYTNAPPTTSGSGDDFIGASSPLWNFYDNYSQNIEWQYDRKRWGQSEVESGGANNSSGAFNASYTDNCPRTPIAPLTNSRTKIMATINDMQPNGGTAGHLGLSWAYYMISPEWNHIWPSESDALRWDEPDAVKAIILMTDGDFLNNHPSASENSTNQAAGICDSIKANNNKNIIIYTIGFQVPSNVQKVNGKTVLEYCASRPEYAFDASNGQQLTDAYTAIASSISDLRIKN